MVAVPLKQVFVAAALCVVSSNALSAQDCQSIAIPKDEATQLPMFSVRYSDDQKSCTVECDLSVNGTFIMGCVGFPDGVTTAMERANLTSKAACMQTMIEAPDKAPDVTDFEMTVTSCPDWFFYLGWDRGQSRKMKNMRTQLVLKSDKSLEAFKASDGPPPKGQSLVSADATGLTSKDCQSIYIQHDDASNLPAFSVRYSEDQKSCTIECDLSINGTFIIGCAAFTDGVTAAMKKANLASDATCEHTMIEAPDKAPDVTDPEVYFTSCPDWFSYLGWDRGQARKMKNMRQEVVLKSSKALDAFKASDVPPLKAQSTISV